MTSTSGANGRGGPAGFRPGPWRVALALVVLVAVGLVAAPAHAAFPGANGSIAFTRAAPTLGGDIWKMDPNGLNQIRLTTVDAADENPAFSPDGQKIAFMSRRDGNAEIYVMNADGTGQVRLTNNAATDDNPAFSGNGSRIAFESNRDGNTEIYVMNADGTGTAVNRTNNAAADEAPAPSPDGRKIAFRSTRSQAQGEIYVMDADGSNPRRLTTNTIIDDDPNFSPNGAKIAFTKGNASNPANIWVLDAADGANETQLSTTSYPSDSRAPSFSPAGADLALSHTGSLFDPPSDQEIFTMPAVANGTMTNRSLTPGASDFAADWGPQPGSTPARPSVSIGGASVTETDSGEVESSLTVSLSAASNTVVEVDFATADDTATSPSDYVQANGTLTFAPGETTKSVTVKVKGDVTQEPEERFRVNLSNARGATAGTMQGVVTIIDNDAPSATPRISIGDTTVTELDSGEVNATFTVSLDAAAAGGEQVDFQTANDTAAAPADYTAAGDTLTFGAGETSKSVTVKVQGDTLDELDERFLVNLSNPQAATIADPRGEGRITDNDAATISIGDTTVTEGNSGEVNATFTVSLSTASDRQVTADYGTANDTATTPADYTALSGTVSFVAGDLSETVTVKVQGDTLDELDERFLVNLSNPGQATIADGQGAGTISDDDGPAPADPAASIGDTTVTEGHSGAVDATFTVSLSAASTKTVTVNYQTANDTATAPADYTAANGMLTFPAGDTSETVTVKVRGDKADEPDERFLVNLSGQTNATLADPSGVGRITDDDAPARTARPAPPAGPPTEKDCVNFRAGMGAKRLGQASLGLTRKRHRSIFKGARLSSRGGIDRSCIAGGGSLRIGYPTARLLRTLSRSERRRVKDRAVLLLTTSKRYSIKGMAPGTSVSTLRRKLRGERSYRVGGITWYLAPGQRARLAFRIRAGRVLEVGLADRRLTRTRRSVRRLLGAWRL